ncbi:MAG: sensor histidine kinase [Anaerolineae bacterium]
MGETLGRWLGRFNRIQWKLTVSYTVVTSAAVLIVALVPVLVRSDQLPRLLGLDARQAANRLAPMVERTPYDSAAMARALTEVTSPDAGPDMPAGDAGAAPRLRFALPAPSFVAVVDADGNVLASRPSLPIGQVFPMNTYPQAGEALRLALLGESDPGRLYVQRSGEELYVAAPILTPDLHVLGAFVRDYPATSVQNYLGEILRFFLPFSLIVIAATAVVGTIFGWLTTRPLVKRLSNVTNAADDWSQGDFSVNIQDRSGDELGELARDLNGMAEQLQRLVQAREELASLEERQRLARDLHDSVKQGMFAVSMNLGAAEALWGQNNDAARAHLETAVTLTRQMQKELTDIIQTLRSEPVQEKGLSQALWEHFGMWEKSTHIALSNDVRLPTVMPVATQEAVYRVIQEGLSNVARHSGATRASVRAAQQGDDLILTIEDNGAGFNADTASGGVGLRSMRERVEALGGRLDVTSGARGTRVQAVIPLREPALQAEGGGR